MISRILEPAGRDLAEAALAVARSLRWPPGASPWRWPAASSWPPPRSRAASSITSPAPGYEADAAPVPEPALGAIVLAGRADVARSGPF